MAMPVAVQEHFLLLAAGRGWDLRRSGLMPVSPGY